MGAMLPDLGIRPEFSQMLERLGSGQKGPERLAHEARGAVQGQDNLGGQWKQGTWDLHINGPSSSGFEMLSAQLVLGSCLWSKRKGTREQEQGQRRGNVSWSRGGSGVNPY